MIHETWDVLYSDVEDNKHAIIEIGLNPLNKNLLLIDMVCRNMSNYYDKEKESIHEYITEEKIKFMSSAENPYDGSSNRS